MANEYASDWSTRFMAHWYCQVAIGLAVVALPLTLAVNAIDQLFVAILSGVTAVAFAAIVWFQWHPGGRRRRSYEAREAGRAPSSGQLPPVVQSVGWLVMAATMVWITILNFDSPVPSPVSSMYTGGYAVLGAVIAVKAILPNSQYRRD